MAVTVSPDAVSVMPSSLWIHRGRPPRMTESHRHDDIEINVVLHGRLDYLFGGSHLTVRAGELAVFWAATPHRLIDPPGGEPGRWSETTRGCWIHLPLATVLSWGLAEAEVGRLLQMTALVTPIEALVHDPDRLFATWQQELADPRHCTPALLEAQAMLRRVLAGHEPPGTPSTCDPGGQSAVMAGVTRMAQFVVERFQEPITIADIAAAAHLNRTYAATIFSRTLGVTLGQYLSRRRVAEAQRLLITSSSSMIDLAHSCGFGSQSSFYQQFSRWCGVSPGAYRRGYGR
jgi:AraC-like DNA-binding protein/mannose-6-phosphate isomerase-like protein (cupin superfamily)